MNFVRYRGYLWVYRSEAIVFAPALVSTSLEMTGQGSVTQGGEPPQTCIWVYHSKAFVFAPARSLDFARDDGARKRYARLAAGRGRPALPRRGTYSKQILAHRDFLSGGRGSPLPFKAFPLGGRWIAEAIAKARRMRGRDMTNVTYKTTPHQSLRDSFPQGEALNSPLTRIFMGIPFQSVRVRSREISRLRSR